MVDEQNRCLHSCNRLIDFAKEIKHEDLSEL